MHKRKVSINHFKDKSYNRILYYILLTLKFNYSKYSISSKINCKLFSYIVTIRCIYGKINNKNNIIFIIEKMN